MKCFLLACSYKFWGSRSWLLTGHKYPRCSKWRGRDSSLVWALFNLGCRAVKHELFGKTPLVTVVLPFGVLVSCLDCPAPLRPGIYSALLLKLSFSTALICFHNIYFKCLLCTYLLFNHLNQRPNIRLSLRTETIFIFLISLSFNTYFGVE